MHNLLYLPIYHFDLLAVFDIRVGRFGTDPLHRVADTLLTTSHKLLYAEPGTPSQYVTRSTQPSIPPG